MGFSTSQREAERASSTPTMAPYLQAMRGQLLGPQTQIRHGDIQQYQAVGFPLSSIAQAWQLPTIRVRIRSTSQILKYPIF